MSLQLAGWKTRITSTMRTNSRMNALLNDSMTMMNLMKRKNLNRLRAASSAGHEFGDGVNPTGESFIDADTCRKANMERIQRIIQQTIEDQMNEEKFFRIYNSQISAKFCQILSREIKGKVKELRYERFRIICLVTLVEKSQQGIDYEMLLCVDPKCDNYATWKHEEATFLIVAAVFMIYKD